MNLLVEANDLAGRGCSKVQVYNELARSRPNRSAEAIKKRLQKLKWSEIPIKPEKRLDSSGGIMQPADAEVDDTAHDNTVELWRGNVLEDVVTKLMNKNDERIKVDRLRRIAEELKNGAVSIDQTQEDIERMVEETFPDKWQKRREGPIRSPPKTKKEIRRANYVTIQRLYKRKKKDAAKVVLDGTWREAYLRDGGVTDSTIEFWKEVFRREGESDTRPVPECTPDWELVQPITEEEIRMALSGMGSKSPGMDKISTDEINKTDKSVIAAFLNMLLAGETPSTTLAKARISLIPKRTSPDQPTDYRPIAVSSILSRLLHKIIARRWSKKVQLGHLQMAFQKRDGCLEATTILQALLRQSHEEIQPLAIAFLDISKAYDSVSHDSIIRCAKRHGAPPPLLRYLEKLYSNSHVMLGDELVRCKRGVRQGDPLSPLLFLMVMDEVLDHAIPDYGVEIDGKRIGCLAYADDLVICAATIDELQDKLRGLEQGLKPTGMEVNGTKSRVLHIRKASKKKHLVLCPTRLQVQSGEVQPMDVEESVTYLGLKFNWKGRSKVNSVPKLIEMLNHISKGPLKQHQRLELLCNFAIPRVKYELVRGMAHRNTLKTMDKLIRERVRSWFRLPGDTSLGFFYADRKSNGLGIPCLSTAVPLEQRKLIEKLATSQCEVTRSLAHFNPVIKIHKRANTTIMVGDRVINSKMESSEAWTEYWRNSADGRSMKNLPLDQCSTTWLRNESIRGRPYTRAVQLLAGTLGTKVRAGRGGRLTAESMRCKFGCGPESLDHILQRCLACHDARCARHNRIVQKVAHALKRKALEVLVEPVIPDGKSYCKPDIVCRQGEKVYVMDVAVAQGNQVTPVYDGKKSKYDKEVINNNLLRMFDIDRTAGKVIHEPLVWSNRGGMYAKSGRTLRRLKISEAVLEGLCFLVVIGSLRCYDVYMLGH